MSEYPEAGSRAARGWVLASVVFTLVLIAIIVLMHEAAR